MDNWFCKNLGDALLAQTALDQIKTRFAAAYAHANQPDDMAIFIRHESEGRLHCEVVVYFTPASASVALAMEAVACRPPPPDDLGLLIGSEQARARLFPQL